MSKKKGLNRKLVRYFEDNQEKVTLDQVVLIMKENPNSLCVIDNLFSFVHFMIDRYPDYHQLQYIYQVSLFIHELLQQESCVVPGLHLKLKRVYSKLQCLQLDYLDFFKMNQEENKWLEKTMKSIQEQFSETMDISSTSCYQLLEFIITDLQDRIYLEKILSHFPKLVNSKSREGEFLFDHIVLEASNKILYEKNLDQDEIFYYFEVIDFIRNHSNFKHCFQQKTLKFLEDARKKVEQNRMGYLLMLEKLYQKDELGKTISPNYNIHVDFSDTLIEELGLYQTSHTKINDQNRVIIDDYIITIDKEGALELDDALSIKKLKNGNMLLGVHIASPLSYLPFSSLLVDEAIQRGSSIYLEEDFKNKSFIPIFPEVFATKLASLVENEPRYAKSYFFEFDSSGYLINQKYLKTVITNHHQSSYQEINEIIEFGSSNKRLQEVVHLLNHLTYLLEEKTNSKDIYLEKKQSRIDPAKLILGDTRSEKIVSTLMMLTGKNVASFFAHSKEGYPTLYRVHEVNDCLFSKLIQDTTSLELRKNLKENPSFYQKILQLYPTASYDMKGSHHGLNLEHYCHCTSPLRRGADLVVEHSLDVCYFKNPSEKEIRKLEEVILAKKEIINEQNRHIDLFLRSHDKAIQKTKNVKSG